MGILDFLTFFNSKPSPEKFAKIFMAFARKEGFDKPMKFDAEEFRIVMDGEGSHVFNLNNAYRDYCTASKAEHNLLLTKYAAGLNAPSFPKKFEDAKAHLMPVIRCKGQGEYLRLMNLLQGKKENPPTIDFSSPFSDDAVLMLAFDTEHSMAMIGQSQLKDWDVSFDTAFEVALSNLRDRTVDNFGNLGDGVMLGQWNDSYDTSRLLLSDVAYRANAGGNPVMMIPTRSCFLLASSTNLAGQRKMVDFALQSLEKDGRPISALMYQMRDGKVVQYHPEDRETIQKLNELKMRNLAEDYASQKNLLEKIYEAQKVDVFVATYALVKRQADGSLRNYCSWTYNVDSLLPQTELVAMVRPGEAGQEAAVKLITWNDAMAIGADILTEVEGYPIRYRAKTFPSPDKVDSVPATMF